MKAATARKIHATLMILWIFPGLPISWYLKNSVPWVVFMSAYAIIVGHASGWSAERPVELEADIDVEVNNNEHS